ncbi:prepilin-type N-terminal cleavage/methylation domain-containing protein [Peptoanaerobacter stomatis]|uniref:prepilin-type N-terminal cleavage/methylation domain-containing protein n=1 Tax=Peptoanaerobacter stomatis TaxID=796937 RepID=UPI003F9F3CC8
MKNKGFTLFEIIISLTLVLIVSGFFVYGNVFITSQQEQQLHRLVSDIRYIKQLSLQKGNNNNKIFIQINKEDNSYTINIDKDKKTVKFSDKIKIETFPTNEGKIIFQGAESDKGITIDLSSSTNTGKKYYKLTVAAISGRVKLTEENK